MHQPSLEELAQGQGLALPEWLSVGPARQVNWRTGDGINGKYAGTKSAGMAATESLLEMGFLDVLEWDHRVAAYFVQPVTMDLLVAGVRTRYTPDVFVMHGTVAKRFMTDPRDRIVEVKPRAVLRRDWHLLRPKFHAARDWCASRNVSFSIVTDRAIGPERLNNLRFLLNYRGPRFVALQPHEFAMRQQIVDMVRVVGVTTPRELLGMLSKLPDRQMEYLPLVWNLLTTGTLHVDLDKKLTMTSPLRHASPLLQSSRSH